MTNNVCNYNHDRKLLILILNSQLPPFVDICSCHCRSSASIKTDSRFLENDVLTKCVINNAQCLNNLMNLLLLPSQV